MKVPTLTPPFLFCDVNTDKVHSTATFIFVSYAQLLQQYLLLAASAQTATPLISCVYIYSNHHLQLAKSHTCSYIAIAGLSRVLPLQYAMEYCSANNVQQNCVCKLTGSHTHRSIEIYFFIVHTHS